MAMKMIFGMCGLVLLVAMHVAPASAQVQQLDCIFVSTISSPEQLLEIARSDTGGCGPAALDHYFELRLLDPRFREAWAGGAAITADFESGCTDVYTLTTPEQLEEVMQRRVQCKTAVMERIEMLLKLQRLKGQ